MVSLFTSDSNAYSVVYFIDKQHMVMRHCAMTEDGPDNNWKVLATWMFDPETDGQKEAESIANDFVDNCSSQTAISVENHKEEKEEGFRRG